MFCDPHFKRHNAVVEMDYTKAGKIKLLNTPFKFSETPAEVRMRLLLSGENTEEILKELLCNTDLDIERFR